MDPYLQKLLAALGICLLAAGLGYWFFTRAHARRKAERANAAAAARAEAVLQAEAARVATEELAHRLTRQRATALEAARAEAARLAQAQAARVEAARLEAARVEATRAEATRLQAARVEAARVEAARAQAARADAARAAAEQAALAQAARLAAEAQAQARAALEAAQRSARLEAERRATPPAPPAPPVPPAAATVPKTPAQTLVMVADDSKLVRIKTGRLLALHQYRVSYATDGLDAANQMRSSMPDVVITDMEMPGMDGFELTRHVRQNPLTAHIPVIMITAADDKHRESANLAGVTVVLGKPYPDEELIAQICLAVARRAA